MITATKVINGLKSAGLCIGSMKQQRYEGYPAYTQVKGSGRVNMSEETYGYYSVLYFRCSDEETSWEAQTLLKGLGGEPNLGWCSGDPCSFSCPISPIKGWHWWQ